MSRIILSVLLILLLSTGMASADFYKWEDEEGNLHITDYPPPVKVAKKLKVHQTDSNADTSVPRTPRTADPPPRSSSPSYDAKPKAVQEVILYTTSWCPYCKQAKAYFDSKGIPYTEYDVEKDSAAAARRNGMGGRGVPFAIVNGERISGYSPVAYEAALKK
jgi:glutaredoxin